MYRKLKEIEKGKEGRRTSLEGTGRCSNSSSIVLESLYRISNIVILKWQRFKVREARPLRISVCSPTRASEATDSRSFLSRQRASVAAQILNLRVPSSAK